jgi:dTDP-D-glucose 4,6-dehydratase
MTKLIKVKDHPHLYRDEDTGAIINYDTLSYNQRIKKIEDQKTQKEELDHMKRDIEEIKSLLKDFLNK